MAMRQDKRDKSGQGARYYDSIETEDPENVVEDRDFQTKNAAAIFFSTFTHAPVIIR